MRQRRSGRLSAAVTSLDAERIRRARADRLGRLGLSAAKIRTLKVTAAEVVKGHLDLDELAEAPADDAHARLIVLHGIGPWTADIYLLFCLDHGNGAPVRAQNCAQGDTLSGHRQ